MIPYIGVTGFTTHEQYDQIRRYFTVRPFTDYRLMTGILVSKTLRGQEPSLPYRGRYPLPAQIEGIWQDQSVRSEHDLWKVIHFNTHQPDFAADLGRIMQLAPSAQAIQLNIHRPNPIELRSFRSLFPHIEVILQFGPQTLLDLNEECNFTCYLEEYLGLVEYVLLDGSGGLNRPLNITLLRRILEATPWNSLGMAAGVAGGLSSQSVGSLSSLLIDSPRLSIDAEGGLRTAGALDMAKTIAYLEASRQVLNT
jgi:hypothetical protein